MSKTKKITKEKKIIIPEKESSKKLAKKFTLEINLNDSNFKAEANSLKEAFLEIISRPNFPFAPKTRVFIKYSNENVLKEKIMNVVMARRIFSIMSHKESAVEIFTNKLEEYLNE